MAQTVSTDTKPKSGAMQCVANNSRLLRATRLALGARREGGRGAEIDIPGIAGKGALDGAFERRQGGVDLGFGDDQQRSEAHEV
ncbi:MAG TPA: hypothetical protein QF630_10835, partial [Alphaproteobacteria bacterium]|nr:hypothetical protein [Alphaproteobacteria bacterium]